VFDILIRGGMVVDGIGGGPARADVAVKDGVIVAVGPGVEGPAREVIDARGLTVTPGFIDVHTHLDAQLFWDPHLHVSAGHGVTTVLIGNCGVGLAPVSVGGAASLIELMEGVEDVPPSAFDVAVPFNWATYAEFLDELSQKRWAIDVATLVAHGPVREYVMGGAGARNEPASDTEIADMAKVVAGAVEAGAFGLSSNRLAGHASRAGRSVAGTFATFEELRSLTEAVTAGGGSFLEVAPASLGGPPDEDLAGLAALSRDTQVPTSFLLLQTSEHPDMWRQRLEFAARANERGSRLIPQIAARPFGMLIGMATSVNPFLLRPTFRRLSNLPFGEMMAGLRRPENRATILAEADQPAIGDRVDNCMVELVRSKLDVLFPLGADLDYEPLPQASVAANATSTGRDPYELIYDHCLGDTEPDYLLLPLLNYANGDHQAIYEQLLTPGTLLGLDDAGAHSRSISDASQPTTVLTHWIRDRSRGPRIDIELAVKKLTSEPAAALGLHDRGAVAVGKRADLNVIDLAALRLLMPTVNDTLPGGNRQLIQGATGYRATIVAGTITRRDDTPTGALPGRLLRRTSER
jgi:N-acyl-D-amino-acid deacylase